MQRFTQIDDKTVQSRAGPLRQGIIVLESIEQSRKTIALHQDPGYKMLKLCPFLSRRSP
jgi:hypothetical protein